MASLLLRCPSLPRALSAALALGLLAPAAAGALPMVRFVATDLPDSVPGQDRWQLDYTVSGFTGPAGHGFSVLFDPAEFAALETPPPVGPDWDVIVLQPDPQLPDFGLYDALALAPAPSFTGPFSVAFTWLGAGAPGPQPFVFYDAAFQPTASGTTSVPEPALALLALAALGVLLLVPAPRRAGPAAAKTPRAAAAARRAADRGHGRAVRRAGAALLVVLLAGGGGCLPAVEHQVDLGAFVLRYRQVAAERVGRTDFQYAYAATLEPKAAPTVVAPRVVLVTSLSAATTVVQGRLDFPATDGAPVDAQIAFEILQDRTVAFDPAQLQFALASAALPAPTASDPAAGDPAAPTSVWPALAFGVDVPAEALAGFGVVCDGSPAAIAVHPLGAREVVLNPAGDLPAGATCQVDVPGGSSVPFSTGGVGMAEVVHDRTDLGRLPPFPDDVHLADDPATATGRRVAWPALDRSQDVRALGEALLQEPRKLDGWSPIGAVVVQLSEAPDPASLPLTPTASLDPLASIGLFDMDPASPEYGQRIPFALTIRDDVLLPHPRTHQIVMYPSRPLRPQGRYAFVLSRRVLAASDGTPFAASSFFAAALAPPAAGEDPLLTRTRTLAQEALAAVADAAVLPIPADDTALALSITVRSTATIPDDALAMKQQVLALPAPPSFTIDSVRAGTGEVAAIVEGTWQAPLWLGGNYLLRDAAGVPVIFLTQPAPFTLALPQAALAGPVPCTMYQHGNPGSAPPEVVGEARDFLAGAGFCVIGFTDLLNRRFPLVEDQFFAIFSNLLIERRIPDFWTQTYGEQMAFLRLIQEGLATLDVLPLGAPDGVPDVDVAAPLTYDGISFGGVHGGALVPYAPEIRAAALVAGGGGFSERLFHQDRTDPLGVGSFFFTTLPVAVPNVQPMDFWAGIQLFQMGYDVQDPNNHAAFTYGSPLPVAGTTRKASVLIMEGLNDSFGTSNMTRAQAWATGPIPQLSPLHEDAPLLPDAQDEVVANVDPQTTAALVQYVPAGVPGIPPSPGCASQPEGHYCVQSAPGSELQRAAFFRTAVEEAAPRIVDPAFDFDGDGIADVQEIVDGTDPDDPFDP